MVATRAPGASVKSMGLWLARRERAESRGGAVFGALTLGALGFGYLLGRPLAAESVSLDRLYWLGLALVGPLPPLAVGALYHDPAHLPLLPLPLAGSAHFRLGGWVFVRTVWPWLLLAVGFGAGVGEGNSLHLRQLLAAYFGAVFAGSAALALGMAGIAGWLADADEAPVRALRLWMAGSYGIERHGPFYIVPALAFALAAVVAAISEAGLRQLVGGASPGSLGRAWLLFLSPLWLGGLVLAIGAWVYGRHALKVIPRVVEAARTIYGGRPAPAEPPYGAAVARGLPASWRPHFWKELREQARAQRGLWGWIALALLGALAYGVNVGAPTAAAPLFAALLVAWVASLPVRRSPKAAGARYLLTLPAPRSAAWLGRWLALLWVGAHLTAGLAFAVGWRHGPGASALLGAQLLATSLLCTAATRSGDAARAGRWGLVAPLASAVGLALALLGLSWSAAGLLAFAGLAAAAVALALPYGLRR